MHWLFLVVYMCGCTTFCAAAATKLSSPSSRRAQVQQRSTTLTSTFVSLMLNPSEGQAFSPERRELHDRGATRNLLDWQLVSHLPFAFAGACAGLNGIVELSLLAGATLILSILYHWNYEKPGNLCAVEGICAKLLFIYGFVQLFRAPSPMVLAMELLCLITTTLTFVVTNSHKNLYDHWHPLGMHIVPSAWGLLVAFFHAPFFF